jgi:hypothetical protein
MNLFKERELIKVILLGPRTGLGGSGNTEVNQETGGADDVTGGMVETGFNLCVAPLDV